MVMIMVDGLTHFLLATLIACAFDTRLSLLLGLDQGVILVTNATGTAFDGAALPLDRAMTVYAHRASRAHGLGRGCAGADDDVAIHAFNGTRNNRFPRRDRSPVYPERNGRRAGEQGPIGNSSGQCCWIRAADWRLRARESYFCPSVSRGEWEFEYTDHGRSWVKEGSQTNIKKAGGRNSRDMTHLTQSNQMCGKFASATKKGKPTNHSTHPHRPRASIHWRVSTRVY
jgi:hypothetical protein